MARDNNRKESMPLFIGFLVLLSIVIKMVNANYLVKVRHKVRIFYATLLYLIGILIMTYAFEHKLLLLALIGTMIFGMAKSFGDAVNQGFLKGFPPSTFVGYSSGTGFAGLAGSFYYLILKI